MNRSIKRLLLAATAAAIVAGPSASALLAADFAPNQTIEVREGDALCTGRCLGGPLRQIAARIGRPCVRVDRNGLSGILH